jgi:hypothetical protein
VPTSLRPDTLDRGVQRLTAAWYWQPRVFAFHIFVGSRPTVVVPGGVVAVAEREALVPARDGQFKPLTPPTSVMVTGPPMEFLEFEAAVIVPVRRELVAGRDPSVTDLHARNVSPTPDTVTVPRTRQPSHPPTS